MDLKEKIINISQTEISGEDSDSAFAYQKNWAFSEMLKFQLKKQEYVFVFEYHDDILLFDSENPKKVTFIQVKKSEKKPWTINRLTNSESDSKGNKKLSILGKLYKHKVDFKEETVNLKFVSNIHYNFNSKKIFVGEDLLSTDKTAVQQKIKSELPELGNIDLDILHFEQSNLNFDGHDTHLLGEIEKFICNYFDESIEVRATALYKTLQIIGERSRNKSDRITCFDDLIRNKGFSNKEITKLLIEIENNSTNKISWDDLCIFLDEFSLNPFEKIQFKGTYEKLVIKRLKSLDYDTNLAFTFTNEFIDKNVVSDITKSLNDFVIDFRNKNSDKERLFSEVELKTIFLWVYCERAKFQNNDSNN